MTNDKMTMSFTLSFAINNVFCNTLYNSLIKTQKAIFLTLNNGLKWLKIGLKWLIQKIT